ncbi:MAG: cystathionine beta-synthase, partial [Maribacter sp.]
MELNKMLDYIKAIVKNMPEDWLKLTTHRLDIYNEELAKVQFLDQFVLLAKANDSSTAAFKELPTAYDYIRLGH